MAVEIRMPKIGLTMKEGKVVEWRKKEGDRVEKGEIVFVFETEKTTFEVEAPGAGILTKILVFPDQTVPVGTVVGEIAESAEAASIPPPTFEVPAQKKEEAPLGFRPRPSIEVRATPLARRMAKEKGLDLRAIPGTGALGRVRRRDVEAFLSNPPPAPKVEVPPSMEKGRLVKFTGMRRIIAEKMLASKVQTAQIYMSHTIDATGILEVREKLLPVFEEKAKVRLTITDLLMKITAAAIARHPVLNTRWTPEGILWLEEIHMGMAMALEEGLIVPVIWDIGKKSLLEIAQTRAKLVDLGRKGKLTPDDMKGSTFTFSSLGMYGIEDFCAIINQPESAILGAGAIIEKPVVVSKEIVIRPMMRVTLSYDHRIIDGAKAAEFMKTLKQWMENPILLLAG